MTMHRLRVTDGPTLTSAVLADLAEPGVVDAQADGLSFGSPDLAFDDLGRSIEGARTVTINLDVPISAKARELAGVRLRDVARAVSSQHRWLMVQRTSITPPVWFRIRRGSPGVVDLTDAHVGAATANLWWSLTLTVDSVSVGEERTLLPVGAATEEVVVTNTGLDRGIVLDVPGEAPAPLQIDLRPTSLINGRRFLVSTFSVPWDSPLIENGKPAIVKDDSGFSPAGAGTRMSRSFLSGGTGIGATLESTSARDLLTGTGGGWQPEPGRYLVMLRLYREGGGGVGEFRVGQSWFDRTAWQPWRTWRPADGGNRASWLPVGYLQHPYGDGGAGLRPDQIISPTIRVGMRGDGGGATVFVDQIAFVPVSLARGDGERAMMAKFDDGVGAGGDTTWDISGEHERVTVRSPFGHHHSTPSPVRTGGWPVGVPGMATCVSVFLDTRDDPIGIDSTTITSAVKVRVAPRFLHLGGA